jgi:hypothetical protein
MKKLIAVALLALSVPVFAAASHADAKAADKSAKKPADKKAESADAGTAK